MGILSNDMWRGFPTNTQLLPGGTPSLPNLLGQPMGKFSQLAYQLAGSPAQKPGTGILLPASPSSGGKSATAPIIGGLLAGAGIANARKGLPNGATNTAANLGGVSPSSAPQVTDTSGGTTTYFPSIDDLNPVSTSVQKIPTMDDLQPVKTTVSKITEPGVGNLLASPRSAIGAAGDAFGIYAGLQQGGVQGYGGALASGADLATRAGYGGAPGSTAGKALGSVGNVYGAYQGIEQGGAKGYATAANDIAGLAGYNIPALSYAGAVDQAAKGNVPGAAVSAISTYLPVAGLGFAAAGLANKAFFGDKTFQRNSNQWLQDTGAQQVTLGRNLSAIKLPDGTVVPAGSVKDLSAAYYSAAFEGGDPKKYYDALAAIKPMTGVNTNAKALQAADTSKGNIYGRLPGKP